MQKKRDKHKIQLAQLCSQIVFLILGGGLQKCFFAENPTTLGVSTYCEKGKTGQKSEKRVESKICPRLRQKSVQVCCAT